MIKYNFCSNCGSKIDERSDPPHCSNCNSTYYQNAKVTVSVLPVLGRQVLLGKRGREPYKGAVDVIGGFMEADEDPESGALREAKEETGLDMKIIKLLGIYHDRYGSNGDYTLNLHYITEVTGGNMKAQDDLVELSWFDISNAPTDQGFQNNRDAIKDLQKWYKNKLNINDSKIRP